MFVFVSKSLNSGLTSRYSTFSDIILSFVSTVFPSRKNKNHLGNTFVVKTTFSIECPNYKRSDFSEVLFSK